MATLGISKSKASEATSGEQPGHKDEEFCFVPAIPPTYHVTLGQ